MEVRTRSRATDAQNFDVHQHGRVMWATDAGKFNNFLSWLIKASQVILSVNTSLKATLYMVVVLALSSLFNILNFQDTISADRHNPVTRYFINQSWTLTFILLSTYNILFSDVYNMRNADLTRTDIPRLLLRRVWCWSFLIFDLIKRALATCSPEQLTNTNECPAAGGHWYEFNISLDIFLLIHCALTISEEMKTYKNWERIGKILYNPNFKPAKYNPILQKKFLNHEAKLKAQKDYTSYTPVISVIVVCLAALLLMFEFMMVVSVIFNYHMVTGNIVAAILAIVGWYISHRILDSIRRENNRLGTIQIN